MTWLWFVLLVPIAFAAALLLRGRVSRWLAVRARRKQSLATMRAYAQGLSIRPNASACSLCTEEKYSVYEIDRCTSIAGERFVFLGRSLATFCARCASVQCGVWNVEIHVRDWYPAWSDDVHARQRIWYDAERAAWKNEQAAREQANTTESPEAPGRVRAPFPV